jgi:hypothetical protein
MDSNYWSRHGETPLGRAMWFPRTAPPARRGTDPERDEKFESISLRQPVCLTGAFHGCTRKGPAFAGSVVRLHTACVRQLKQFDLELFSLQIDPRRVRSGRQFAGRSPKLT